MSMFSDQTLSEVSAAYRNNDVFVAGRVGPPLGSSRPIIGYEPDSFSNRVWRRLGRILNYPTRFMACETFDQCEHNDDEGCVVTFRPAEWAFSRVKPRTPIYDPDWIAAQSKMVTFTRSEWFRDSPADD